MEARHALSKHVKIQEDLKMGLTEFLPKNKSKQMGKTFSPINSGLLVALKNYSG